MCTHFRTTVFGYFLFVHVLLVLEEQTDTATGMKLQMHQLQADAENIQTKTAEAR